MKNKILLTIISICGISLTGCTASISTETNSPTNTTPANTATKHTANSNTTTKSDSSKPTLKNEKKPEGKAKTAKKDVPVPSDWVYVYDENKGYGFSVPEGTTGESETIDNIDVFAASTPSEIDIFVLAFKDKTLTKEDLLQSAVEFLEGLGQKVTPGDLKAESDEYAVADATTQTEDGRKGKLRILVGTDVTDNYIMIIGTETDKFTANEKIIDEIWGSFEMWSSK